MLSFPSQNDKKNFFFPTGRVYSKKQTRVTATQHIFKSGLISILIQIHEARRVNMGIFNDLIF